MKLGSISSIIVLLVSCMTSSNKGLDDGVRAEGSVAFQDPVRVSASSDADFSPEISPKGDYVFYVADRLGNKDIWQKPVVGGVARRVTTHVADDFKPMVSPDGTKLAFVSRRDDALGDIYIMELSPAWLSRAPSDGREHPMIRLARPESEEASPAWLPDGQGLIFTSKRFGAEEPEILRYDLKTGVARDLGHLYGAQAAVAPDGSAVAFVRGGALFTYDLTSANVRRLLPHSELQDGQPRFGLSANEILFIRYADDTNRDGKLNAEDRPTLWRMTGDFAAPKARASRLVPEVLSSAKWGGYTPVKNGPWVYSAMETADGINIYRLPDHGHVQLKVVANDVDPVLFDLESEEDEIYALRRAQAYFATDVRDPAKAGLYALKELRRYVRSGRGVEARIKLKEITDTYGDHPGVVWLAEVEGLALTVQRFAYPRADRDLSVAEKATVGVIKQKARALLATVQGQTQRPASERAHVVMAAATLLARLAASEKDFVAASRWIETAQTQPGEDREIGGMTAIVKALLAKDLAGEDAALTMLTAVARHYRDQKVIVQQVTEYALGIASDSDVPGEALQKVIALSRDVPYIAAHAHLAFAERFKKDKKEEAHANELRQIVEHYAEDPAVRVDAAKKLSEIAERRGDFVSARRVWVGLDKTFQPKAGRWYSSLKSSMEQFYVRDAGVYLAQGKAEEARDACQQALGINPLGVSAHRCLIDALVRLQGAERVVQSYQETAEANDAGALHRYLFGYALTYLVDDADSDADRIQALEKVIQVTEAARDLDSQMPQIHQTLGWAYQQIGHWRRVRQERGGLREGLRKRVGMVTRFMGARPDVGIEDSIDAFDTAYYLASKGSVERAVLAQNLGHSFYELKSYQKSLDYFLERIAVMDVLPIADKRVEGALLRRAARAAFQVENLDLAAQLQRAALGVWEKVGMDKETAYSLDALALTYRELGNWQQASDLYGRLLRLEERLNQTVNRTGTLTNLGYCAFSQGLYEQALDYFNQAEALIAKLEAGDHDQESAEKDHQDAIAVDVGGEKSAAKGFDLFARRNLVVTFKGLIYEEMGRFDLAAGLVREKIALLEAEEQRRAKKTGKGQTLADARIIAMSRLGHLASKLGEEGAGSQAYGDAGNLAKTLRPERETGPTHLEIQSEVNRSRLRLRMASLGLLGKREMQEEVERLKVYIRDLQREGDPGLSERTQGVFDLVGSGRSLESLVSSDSQSEFTRYVTKEIEKRDFSLKKASIRPASVELLRQVMPELMGEHFPDGSPEGEGAAGDLDAHSEREVGATWPRLASRGLYEEAWSDIEQRSRRGAITTSPMERLAIRKLWEARIKKNLPTLDPQAALAGWRGYLSMGLVDLMRRGGLLPSRPQVRDPSASSAEPDAKVPEYLATSMADIQNVLSAREAILMAHSRLDGEIYLGMISKSGQLFWHGTILASAENKMKEALLQSGFSERLQQLEHLYVVPSSELFDLGWEGILKTVVRRSDRAAMSFIPSPDLLPFLVKKRLTPRHRVAVVRSKTEDKDAEGRWRETVGGESRLVATEDLSAGQDRLDHDEAVYLLEPLAINDVEPHLSQLVGNQSQLKPNTLSVTLSAWREVCPKVAKDKAFVVVSAARRATTDYAKNIDAHDGWAYTLLCSAHHGTPAVLWAESKNPPDGVQPDTRAHGERVDAAYWSNFYARMATLSLRDTVLALDYPGRVLGDLGPSTDAEKSIARESYGQILEAAEDAYEDGNFKASRDLFRRALFLGRIAGIGDETKVLTKLVATDFQLRDFKSAYFYQQKKVTVIRGEDLEPKNEALGEALVDAAVLAVRAESYAQAKELLDEAETFYKAKADAKVLGKIDQYRAINAENQGAYEESIAWYQASRAHYLKVDEDEAAQRLLNIGNIYNARLSDLPKALEYYQEARAYFHDEEQVEAEIKVLIDISNALIAMGDLGQAITLLENQVLGKLQKNKSLDVWIRSKQMLANAYLRRGQFDDAQRLCAEIIAAAGKMTDPKDVERRDQRLIDAFGLRAYLLAAQGLYQEAFDEFEATLEKALAKKLESQAAVLFNNYGFWLREVGNLEKSVAMLEQAERLDSKLKSKSGLAVDLRNLGLSLIALGDLSRAKDLLERSLEESKSLFLTYNIAYCQFGLGDIAMREGRLGDGESRFREALGLAQKGMMPDMEWRALGAIGRVAQLEGRRKDAVASFRQALAKIEEREGGLRSEASRNAFQSDAGTQEIYAHFAKVLMDDGQISDAWEVAERARSRAYVDAVGTKKVILARKKSRELKDKEREVRQEMEQSLLASRISPQSQDRRTRADEATARYFAVLSEIEKADYQLVDLLRVRNVALGEFSKILPRDVAVLSYLVTPSHLLLWCLRNGELRGAQVAIPSGQLEKKVDEYRVLFENFSSTAYVGQDLAEILLGPVKTWIEDVPHLVIIPHRALHFVPFAALPYGTKHLMDLAPLSYVESARVAAHLFTQGKRVRVSKDHRIAALVDPKRTRDQVAALPYAQREVEAMGRYYTNIRRFAGETASEAVLRKGTKEYQILHIGAHGEFRPDQPVSSRLLLAESGDNDGNLDVVGILGLPEQAEHVTLSACESGRGVVGSGDDVVSLDRSFFYAGAKTVVSSLWRMSDVTSAVTMKRYYRYLSEGDGPSKAMQRAQMVVRKYFPHPAYWASFRVIGDGL